MSCSSKAKYKAKCLVQRLGQRRPSRDESGAAVMLWMVLMVPVAIFAALVAMAGPQRLAAESSVREIADDLARFAAESHEVADGWMVTIRNINEGKDPYIHPLILPPNLIPLTLERPIEPPLPVDCRITDESDLLGNLKPYLDALLDGINAQQSILGRDVDAEVKAAARTLQLNYKWQFDVVTDLRDESEQLKEECERFTNQFAAGLGRLGIDISSLRGYYIDFDGDEPDSWDRPVCIIREEIEIQTDDPTNDPIIVPQLEAFEVVRVTLFVDWKSAGWAVAQVWADGIRLGAESIGASVKPAPEVGEGVVREPQEDCTMLRDIDPSGRPRQRSDEWDRFPRLPRNPFSG